MGIFSEIATDNAIRLFVAKIEEELYDNRDKPDVCKALKKLGRFALEQFEWDIPDWANKYEELFKE